MDADNTRLTPPPLAPPTTTTTKVTPSKIAGTSAPSDFREGSGRAHLAPSLLVDLKRKQDVSVDEFLTGLLGFVRDKRAFSEPQQPTASGSNSPEMSLSDLTLQVGVKVANLFCQQSGTTPSGAAVSTTRATNGKGYGHNLLQEFCKADNETKRYPIFCKLVNSILARTKSENLQGFLDNSDLDILLQNTSLFEVKIYHQGEESTRKPDCTFLPSAIAKMYHDPAMVAGRTTRGNRAVKPDDRHQLWNAIVDKVAGSSLNTKFMHMEWDIHLGVVEKKTGVSIQHHKVPTSFAGNELIDKKPNSSLLYTTTKQCDPTNPRYPSRNSLLQGAVENDRKRKAASLGEVRDETNGTDAQIAKRVKTLSNGALPRPHSMPEDASKVHMKPPQDIPEVQFAGYNAEMLCAPTVIRQHTIGMLNEDKYVHLWWFDHQSPVQSAPLNFIDDLPRFVVFLWILQRLTREGWGYVPIMVPVPKAGAEERLIAKENAEAKGKAKEKPKTKLPLTTPAEIKCKGETYFTDDAYARKHHIWGLNGRKTCVREMRGRENPGVAVAVKVAWQEQSRTSEQKIFDQINCVAKKDPKVKDHVPELLREETFAEYSTGTFRIHAGIPCEARGTGYRVLRITVYTMLDGCITDLEGDDFWRVLLQCFDCHYKLWLSHVHHRDISAFNLMYKRREDGTIVGVLIDFDLAILRGSQSTNTERTGTMPFMALDILAGIAADTHQTHLYRHDMESFLWVAIWVCGTYEGGKERQDASFKAWTEGDALHCCAYKAVFLRNRAAILWSKGHQARVDILSKIRNRLRVDDFNRGLQEEGIQPASGMVEPEGPERPDTDYNTIDDNVFSALRKELGE